MTDRIEVYVQPGRYGFHAGGRFPCRTYAAHATDPATAAWRCALKYWFPSRPNGVILYREANAISIRPITENEWAATLTISPDLLDTYQFARGITPQLLIENNPTKPLPMPAKKKRRKPL